MSRRETPGKLRLTKLEAARRQIKTAILLWFYDDDPVSVHTLTAAANRVLLDIAEKQGQTIMPFDMKHVKEGYAKEVKKALRTYETFLKHAKNDSGDELDFDPSYTTMYLYFTTEGYEVLVPHGSTLIMRFYRLGLRFLTLICLPQLAHCSKKTRTFSGLRKALEGKSLRASQTEELNPPPPCHF